MRTRFLLAFAAITGLAVPVAKGDEPVPRGVLGIGPASVNVRALEAERGLLFAVLRYQAAHVSSGFLGEIGYFANMPLKL